MNNIIYVENRKSRRLKRFSLATSLLVLPSLSKAVAVDITGPATSAIDSLTTQIGALVGPIFTLFGLALGIVVLLMLVKKAAKLATG